MNRGTTTQPLVTSVYKRHANTPLGGPVKSQVGDAASLRNRLEARRRGNGCRRCSSCCERMGIGIGRVVQTPIGSRAIVRRRHAAGSPLLPSGRTAGTTRKELASAHALIPVWTRVGGPVTDARGAAGTWSTGTRTVGQRADADSAGAIERRTRRSLLMWCTVSVVRVIVSICRYLAVVRHNAMTTCRSRPGIIKFIDWVNYFVRPTRRGSRVAG